MAARQSEVVYQVAITLLPNKFPCYGEGRSDMEL
jgi:hypothetical protein